MFSAHGLTLQREVASDQEIGAFFTEKKKKGRIGESRGSHCTREKAPECDLSQRVIFGKFTFHSWI